MKGFPWPFLPLFPEERGMPKISLPASLLRLKLFCDFAHNPGNSGGTLLNPLYFPKN
jgi:hypothetical protein